MADKDSNETNILRAAGSGVELPPQSVPVSSYLNEIKEEPLVDIPSTNALSTAGALHVARPARFKLVARQNWCSNRGTSAPYSFGRGRGRQSRQYSGPLAPDARQQMPISYSQGWNVRMPGSTSMRGGLLGKTNLPPLQIIPGTSYHNEIIDGQSADIHNASAPSTSQSTNSAEVLSTTASDNSTEHQQQTDTGAVCVARPTRLELVAHQNRCSNRGTSAPYSFGRGRGRQSRQDTRSSAASNDAGQQNPSSYSRGGDNAMTGSISIRGGQYGMTSMKTVRRQMFIADSGQNNSLRLGSSLGNCMNLRTGQFNTVEMSFAMANWIDLGGGKSNRTVISRAEENVIDLRESQSSALDLISGGGNVVNLSSAQGNRITVGSVNDHNRTVFDCGQGNQIIFHTRWGAGAEDIQFFRFGNHRLIWFRNNFIIQKPLDATLPNCFVHTVCNTFPLSGSVVYNDDNDDFRDAPAAMTSDDAKLLPTRRLFSTVAMQDKQCHVCRRDFEDKCVSRILPCLHEFHMQCIDEFLSGNSFCPGCRQVVYGEE